MTWNDLYILDESIKYKLYIHVQFLLHIRRIL